MDTEIAYFALLVCIGLLSGSSNASNLLMAALTDTLVPCGDIHCRNATEICNDQICECKPNFEDIGTFECVPCPGEGLHCRGCCMTDALICYRGICQRCDTDSNGNCITQESLFFLTAAQVALATAMVLGVISLSFLLYKTLRSRLRRNNNQTAPSEFRQSVVSRVSLSSIQQRVVRRLRDRPPKYETRHNYEHQQRQMEPQNSQQNTPASPPPSEDATQQRTIPINGPPPAYEGDTMSLAENPPPYTAEPTGDDRVAVIDIPLTNRLPVDSSPGTTEASTIDARELQGIDNQVFEPDKPAQSPAAELKGEGESVEHAQTRCYDIPLVTNDDKTVYM
ncbi:uncharacterized protein LOC125948612 isoform X1 [Anopheles darlingi]|uniref:uncharacterized protein LOC125948612 isoform X1 n=1 Tax=Anopheles darlingi TaxID=43151 RepID=UPI0021000120|nr:uncharacterized protein LOC125948612 isoform X1 [Anopheles darlingi]XP_049530817.1 uncharacterized protein LOC125948612 isoform X1 [Anopheles darlingi]XP_049530818.1 uncharacterized protein LOC125948612 isoform X1 [Anopheles darlingi]